MLHPPTLFTTWQASTPFPIVQLNSRVKLGAAVFEATRSAAGHRERAIAVGVVRRGQVLGRAVVRVRLPTRIEHGEEVRAVAEVVLSARRAAVDPDVFLRT